MQLGLVTSDAAAGARAVDRLLAAGAQGVESAVLVLTGDPVEDRLELDRVLDAVEGRRIALDLPLGDLAALLHRLMRRGEIETAETAVLGPRPASLMPLGLPGDPSAAARLAVHGRARAVGLLKDDSGGVLIDSAHLTAWPDASGSIAKDFWLRAYVDDTPVSDGTATALTVQRIGPNRLRATTQRPGLLRRARVVEGRALQLACSDALIVSDGVPRERSRDKRTWWGEPTYWRVALP
ncbi:MAG: hypothetical protein JWN20_1227 [Jatrophihabitantaceae bacterium]|nr:hypothetical protein [Jatrophihabitantaceae bacterium]